MKIRAYCTESAGEAVAAATGVQPLTSPPITATNFREMWLGPCDLLYVRLHGAPGRAGWFNDAGQQALAPVQAELIDLDDAVVVVANCYGDSDQRMIDALYKAGAAVVIAGSGENIGSANRVRGTDLLVRWLIRGMRLGLGVEKALGLARARLALTSWRAADKDARQFKMIKQEGRE